VEEGFFLQSQDCVYIGHARRRRKNKNPKTLLTDHSLNLLRNNDNLRQDSEPPRAFNSRLVAPTVRGRTSLTYLAINGGPRDGSKTVVNAAGVETELLLDNAARALTY